MAKALDPKVKQIVLDDALPYELNMLEQTFLALQAVQPSVLGNALIESFCLHARQLIDFFENEQGVTAEQFTVSDTYVAKETPGIPKGLRTKLNTQIAHLTAKRTSNEADKIGPADRQLLLQKLIPESQLFALQLSPEDRELLESKFKPTVLFATSGTPSATSAPMV
jgi:hypothetical protein